MSFGVLALIAAAGLFGPLLAAIPGIRLPLVVGEIAAGVLIGRTGLGWLDPDEPTLAFLAQVGFAMLMFVVGTRLPLRQSSLRGALRPAAAATGLLVLFTVPAGYLLTIVGPPRPLMLAVLAATSSAAVALPILQDVGRKIAGSPIAVFATTWITMTDILTMLAVPLVLATGGLGNVLAGATLVLVAGLAAFFLLRAIRATETARKIRRLSKRRGWALDLRVGLVLLFSLAALAVAFGTSVLIAGFVAGALLSATGRPRRLGQQLLGVAEGFFVPLFFVTLGARLEFTQMFSSPRAIALCAGLVVASVVIHLIVVLVLRKPVAVGLLATAALGVPSAVVDIGLRQGILDAGQAAAIISAVLLSIGVAAIGGSMLAKVRPGGSPNLDAH